MTQIDAGNVASYAITPTGSELAWGLNNHGQLGIGTTDEQVHLKAAPVHFPAGVQIASLGEAEGEAAAVDTTGRAWVWGYNVYSSLCVKGGNISTPIPGPLTGVQAVQGGEAHMIWLMADGTVRACGVNARGQLGNGTFENSGAKPVEVVGLSHVVEISAGELDSCARTESGEVYTWGGNENGQLGVGTTQASAVPVRVPLPGKASQISCGGNQPYNGHSLAIVEGQLYAWGDDGNGQIGDGSTENKLSPVAVLPAYKFVKVIASGSSSMGLDGEGNVWTWGSGAQGALGTGTSRASSAPVLIDTEARLISGTATNNIDGG